jgi:trehalose 6-phosphate synthase
MSQKAQSAASPQTVSERIHDDHLIIVTNRGPVEDYLGQDKTLRYCRGEGGVVTALIEAMPSIDTTWVALAMTEGDRMAVQRAHAAPFSRSRSR